jgi:predicted nucleic acid-binding protein
VRLFLDANVLFSAARNPDGRAAAILALAGPGLCELLTSPHAVEEARRNLSLKHPDRVARLEEMLRAVVIGREASPQGVAWALAETLPPKDAPILAAAVDAQAALLVTGDLTHFGHLCGKTIRGVKVITPVTALARVLGRRRVHSNLI